MRIPKQARYTIHRCTERSLWVSDVSCCMHKSRVLQYHENKVEEDDATQASIQRIENAHQIVTKTCQTIYSSMPSCKHCIFCGMHPWRCRCSWVCHWYHITYVEHILFSYPCVCRGCICPSPPLRVAQGTNLCLLSSHLVAFTRYFNNARNNW